MVAKKTPKTRNRRSDSAAAAVQAMANALAGELQPPAGLVLPAAARKFWTRIIGNRPRDRWNDLDLCNAVELARMFADIERLRAMVESEGDVTAGKPHPAHKLLDTTGRRAVALSRMLHVHAEATEGRSANCSNALAGEQQARAAASVDDGLIPGVRLQ